MEILALAKMNVKCCWWKSTERSLNNIISMVAWRNFITNINITSNNRVLSTSSPCWQPFVISVFLLRARSRCNVLRSLIALFIHRNPRYLWVFTIVNRPFSTANWCTSTICWQPDDPSTDMSGFRDRSFPVINGRSFSALGLRRMTATTTTIPPLNWAWIVVVRCRLSNAKLLFQFF